METPPSGVSVTSPFPATDAVARKTARNGEADAAAGAFVAWNGTRVSVVVTS